jgi:hypothetical protein
MSSIVIERNPQGAANTPVFTGGSRWAAGALVVTGAALQVVEFALASSTDDNVARVADWVARPERAEASMAVGLLAVPFLLGGFVVMLSIARRHSRRLAVAAGACLILAMCGLAGVHGFEMAALAQALGGDPEAAVAILDGEHVGASTVALMIMFMGGAVFGTTLLAIVIWRSPLLPRLAALGIIAFGVTDFAAGLPVPAHLVALANSVLIAWAVVTGYTRTPRVDAQ